MTRAKRSFWSFVVKGEGAACWLWMGAQVPGGYGVWRGPAGRVLVHRHVLAEQLGRLLVDGEFACHRCDRPSCVRPDHLFVGTTADNVRDAISKGRFAGGRLSVEAAEEIRALHGREPAHAVAARFGITRRHVHNVWSMHAWRPSHDPRNRTPALEWCAGGADRAIERSLR